jgi:predicted nucleic acid-binding Zn ribbon protein
VTEDETSATPPDDDLARAMLAQARTGDRARVQPRRSGSGKSRRTGRSSGGGYSGPAPDGRDPQLIGSSVDDLVSDRGWSQPLAIGGVEGRWAQIVGTDVAAHCWPEEFEDGRLVVRADSTAWATQVRLLSMTLLARLNDDLGAGTVTHLHVLGPKGPSWKKGRLRVKGRGPRDTYG